MKVLFVCSGNKKSGIGIIVKNQGDSLEKLGISIDYFTINGKGLSSYIKHVFILKRYFKNNPCSLVHAHYSLSAITATLAGCKPIVVSLMGSDIYSNFPWNKLLGLFHQLFWDCTLVKSRNMKVDLGLNNCEILPNGVNLELFKPYNKQMAKNMLGLSLHKKYVLFVADPRRPEKNYSLARKTMDVLDDFDVELLNISNVPNEMMPMYYNAVDVLLLTSIYEGSVNVVKEAMACNLSIVSTDVGDVRYNINSVEGCFICEGSPEYLANGLRKALQICNDTNGRERIKYLQLDSVSIAKRIIKIYERIIV